MSENTNVVEPNTVLNSTPNFNTTTRFLSAEYLTIIKSLSTWMKVYAVFLWISSVFLFLSGLVYLLVIFGIGLLAAGVFSIFFGIKLWNSAELLQSILDNNTQENYNQKTLSIISNLEFYFKYQSILQIVAIVLSIIISMLLLVISFLYASRV